MDRHIKKIIAMLTLAIISFSLSLGLLAEPKIQSSIPKNAALTNNLIVANSENRTNLKNTYTDNYSSIQILSEPQTSSTADSSSIADLSAITFQVTTDYGYICTAGEPTKAIQDAIDSLPEERTTPCNVYLQGVFQPVGSIIMKDNVNFMGKDAMLISESQQPIFTYDSAKNYCETIGPTFMIDDKPYQDWITLHNVTFQSIHFKQ